MRTSILTQIVLVLILAVGVGAEAQKTQTPGQERIAVLEKPQENETAEEKAVRLRALEIELKAELERVREERSKTEFPSVRKARKEIAKAQETLAKLDKQEREAYARAAITGCDEGTVKVNPAAEQSSGLRVMVTAHVTNTMTSLMNIETSSRGLGVIVQDLCPGGSVSVSFVQNHIGEDEDIVLVAVSRPPNAQVQTQTLTLQIQGGNARYRRVDSRVWTIR